MRLKKILMFFVAATLLVVSAMAVVVIADTDGTFEVGVTAETDAPISSSPLIINQGEEITVQISVNKNAGVSILSYQVHYDLNALEYVSHTEDVLMGGTVGVNEEEGYLLFTKTDTEHILKSTGDSFTVTFRAKADFCGEAAIKVAVRQDNPYWCMDKNENVIPFVGSSVDMQLHNLDAEAGVVTDPTCLEEGFTTYHCSACDEDVVGNIVDALGHSIEYVDAQEPTCTEIGWDTYEYCSECDYSTYVEIPANGHTEGEVVVENEVSPDCVNNGSYDNVVYCEVCDAEVSRETIVVDALGHNEGEVVVENNVDPDCVNTGSYDNVVYCEVCGEELSRETITVDALGHTEGDVVVENNVDPDCVNAGSYDNVVYCEVCGEELSRETIIVGAFGHTEGGVVIENNVAPDCVNNGGYDKVVYCVICNAELSRETITIAANGHVSGGVVVENNVAPDCVNNGSYDKVVYCVVCDEEISRETIVVDALGHTEVIDEAVAPTCENTGLTEGTHCANNCGIGTVAQVEVPVIECNFVNGVCTMCGVAESHVCTPAEAVKENNVDPTCTANGSYDMVVYCEGCGDKLSTEHFDVEATGHNFEDGACTKCGEADPDAAPVAVLTLTASDFTNKSYADNNKTHTKNGYSYTSYQVMKQSYMQWQKSKGYITFVNPGFKKLELVSTAGTFTVTVGGKTVKGTSASGITTYDFTGLTGEVKITVGSATGQVTSITLYK